MWFAASLLAALASLQTPPPKPMDGLAFLLGDWESHETTKGPEGEVPFTLKGRNRMVMEESCLQIDESFEVPKAGKFANHILMTFDPRISKFRAYWFTNRRPTPIQLTGERTEKTFVLNEVEGKFRIRYDLLEDGHYKAVVEAKQGDEWAKQTEAEYRRTGK